LSVYFNYKLITYNTQFCKNGAFEMILFIVVKQNTINAIYLESV